MKRCPQCYQPYSDAEQFCELDGRPLLADVVLTPPVGQVVESATVPEGSPQQTAPVMVIVGVIVGIMLTSMVYVGYAFWTSEPSADDTKDSVSKIETVDTRQPRPAPRTEVTEPSPVPEEESSPSPEAEEEAATAAVADDASVTARLNQGPVSTGERKDFKDESISDKATIEMNDGTTIDVDAAWQDKQGIWYRRGSMVSFVDSNRIKTIHARREAKPDAVSSPSP